MPYPVPVPAYGWGPYWDGWNDWYGDFGAGVVTGALVGAAVATASNPGTVVTALPAGCVEVIRKGVTYEQCGATWYKPQYAGTVVQYVVVTPPSAPDGL